MSKNKKNIGQKARNIELLKKSSFYIPFTKILSLNEFKNIGDYNLSQYKKYIIRPSFIGEDSKDTSNAGIFNSIGPITLDDLIEISKQDPEQLLKKMGSNGASLGAIILQEFIIGKKYGVYFTGNPLNIVFKGGFESGGENNTITSGQKHNQKLTFIESINLKSIAKKIEVIFGFPQDIEFAIQNGKIYILQTRNITTGKNFFPDFHIVKKYTGIFSNIDNGEFGNIPYLGSSFLLGIFDIFVISGNIYAKYSILKSNKNHEILRKFQKKYKKYLIVKGINSLLQKMLFFQKYDTGVLKMIFSNYNYSFDLFIKSNTDKNFNLKSNFKTKLFLKSEYLKNKAFLELEKIKYILIQKNKYGLDASYLSITELLEENLDHHKKIITRKKYFLKEHTQTKKIYVKEGKLLQNYEKIFSKNDTKVWIFKGNIDGDGVPLKDIDTTSNMKYIGIAESLNINLYPYLGNLNGLIVKSGSIYSHNAILLREYKIPSYITI